MPGSARWPPRKDLTSSLTEEGLCGLVQVVGDGLGLGGGLVEGNGDDVVASERDHLAPLAVLDGFGCPEPVAGREDAVEGGRGAAALQVAKDDVAGVYAGALLELSGKAFADAAEPYVAELVLLGVLGHEVLAEGHALAHGDDAPLISSFGALLEEVGDGIEVRFHLGDQGDVRGGSEAGAPGDPTRVAAHDLDDDDPLVAPGGGSYPVYCLGGYRDGRVVAEGRVGRREVVVYGLGTPDDLHPEVVVEPLGDT